MKKITFIILIGLVSWKLKAQSVFVTDTFQFTGSNNMFIVPPCVDTLFIQTWGAEGGAGSSNAGGLGGHAEGHLLVNAGDTLYIYVGGRGQNHDYNGTVDYEALGGWNGGGNGGFDNSGQVMNGGGGGGSSDVRYMDTTLLSRVIVAGGGGGGAGGVFTPALGGSGGGLTGGDGGFTYTASGGTGGTQSAGGLANTLLRGATNGTLWLGGNGSTNQNAWGSGGGGGGYYGGGGGTSNNDHGSGHAGAGGGGSSYIGGVLNGVTNSGIRSGNGLVIIQYTVSPPPSVTFTVTPNTACDNLNSYTISGGTPVGGVYSGTGVSGTNFDAFVAGVGEHPITYTFTDSLGCSGSAVDSITVYPAPVVTFTYSGEDTVCINYSSITLSGGNPTGGLYAGNGVFSGNFDPNSAGVGTHNILYSYTDINGCMNSQGGVSITVLGCAGIDNNNQDTHISVYPNPFESSTLVEIIDNTISNGMYQIMDITGKTIIQNNFSGNQFYIYRESMSAGIYQLVIYSDNKIYSTSRLIIK